LDMHGNGDRCSLIHSDDCYHRTSEWFIMHGHDVAYSPNGPLPADHNLMNLIDPGMLVLVLWASACFETV